MDSTRRLKLCSFHPAQFTDAQLDNTSHFLCWQGALFCGKRLMCDDKQFFIKEAVQLQLSPHSKRQLGLTGPGPSVWT